MRLVRASDSDLPLPLHYRAPWATDAKGLHATPVKPGYVGKKARTKHIADPSCPLALRA